MMRHLLNISKKGHKLSRQPVPMFSHTHNKKVYPDVQREPPVLQFVPISSAPVPGHHRKEPDSILSAPSFQIFIYIEKITPEPPLLQAEQS